MSKSSEKKTLKRKFKNSSGKCNGLKEHFKGKKRLKLAEGHTSMSSRATSSSHSTASSKEFPSGSRTEVNEDSVKTQCDLCKLSYSCQAKLTEHLVSLMHHTKLDDAEKSPKHECILCKRTFTDMPSYRDHIGTKKHLKKLDMLRGQDKEKPLKNSSQEQNRRKEIEQSGHDTQYHQSAHFHNQYNDGSQDWPASKQYRGHGEGNFQHFYNQFSQHFNQVLWQNTNMQRQHKFDRSYNNGWKGTDHYRGNQSGWGRYPDDNIGSQNERLNQGQHRKEKRDLKNSTEKDIPWGSKAINFKPAPSNDLRKHNPNMNYNNYGSRDFNEDNFAYCWDEQSFRQHEDFLADMDQSYSHDTMGSYHNGRQPQSHFGSQRKNYRPDPEPSGSEKWNRPSLNDRKRPRQGDSPTDSTAKSSKSFGQKENIDSGDKPTPISHTHGSKHLNSSTSRSLPQNQNVVLDSQKYDEAVYHDKSHLNNASDTILERAEKLCKELREKREASTVQRNSLLKSQNHHSINDKMNSLKKTQQSYMKGHIKGTTKDLASSGNSSPSSSKFPVANSSPNSTVSSVVSYSIKTSQNDAPSSSSSKVKTLDEIRKSIEQSVLEDSRSTANTTSTDKGPGRRRTSSLCESSLSSNIPDSAQSSEKSPSLAEREERFGKLPPKPDSVGASNLKTVAKGGSKQPISKEHLNKMVNCPRSRTERVKLARMFQSRGDTRSSAPISSRANINLEGLYDSSDLTDVQLDIGDDMATIKLEELSDDVRSQILDLIQVDIGNLHEKQLDDVAQTLESDAKKTRKKGSILLEKDMAQRKPKNKTVNDKIQKRNKNAAGVLEGNSISVDHFVSPDVNLAEVENAGGAGYVLNTEQEDVRSAFHSESFSSMPKQNIKDNTAIQRLSKQSSTDLDSSLLTSENVSSRFPTIMSSLGKKDSLFVEEKREQSSVDSGRSSMSLPSSSLTSLPVTSPSSLSMFEPSISLQSTASFDSRMPTPSTNSISSLSVPVGLTNEMPSLSEDRRQKEQDAYSLGIDSANDRASVTSHISESSNTMSELLTLSEQEKCVKQEMTSMELRLTRLHRLLEQAVYQINKCTERRNQLQDEEKGLMNRRISLLREATSSQQDEHSVVPDLSEEISTNPSSETTRINRTAPSVVPDRSSSHLPPPSHDSVNKESSSLESSLSKSEWLAKFSAYLPIDPLSSKGNSTVRASVSYASSVNNSVQSVASNSNARQLPMPASYLSLLQMVPERDSEPSLCSARSGDLRPTPVDDNESMGQDTIVGRSTSKSNASNLDPVSSSSHEFTSPIMYVGTIKSGAKQSNENNMPAPVMVLKNATISSLFNDGAESGIHNINLNPVRITGVGEQAAEPPKESPIPPVTRQTSIGSPRQDDSDIGSVASVASGSSLGEQISRYCRFTPGASIDGHKPHELSVILSGPSDTSELKGLDDDPEDSDVSKKSKDFNKLKEDSGNSRLYGRLDKESIKSAEALHLMERNHEVPSTSTIDKKKKKRKTKNQRDSGVRGRQKPYVISSSSADEQVTEINAVSSLEKRLRKSPESTTDDDSSIDLTGTRPLRSKLNNLESNGPGQEASYLASNKTTYNNKTEITVAECDSSTNLGMVDSQRLNQTSSRLKEMNESFVKNFGRKPRYVNTKTSKGTKDNAIILSDSEDQRGHEDEENPQIVDLCDNVYSTDGALVCSNLNKENFSRYPGSHGPVCYLHFKDETIYVGFLQHGFKVINLSSQSTNNKHLIVPSLSCMEVACLSNDVRAIVGSGDWLFMYDLKNDNKRDVDLGTTVKCLHVLQHSLFAGLDTGEICVRDIKSWKETNRYICSDCPIHEMASGSEGGTKLLCVASQDSTITVVDAERCLPLRILVGHSKTAFSVQVHEQFVFSGSGDSTVVIHNLHTARVEKVYNDNKGMVNCVFYSRGHLFTGGMDRLVRCYNVKTHKLVQVYYGADMGVVKAIYVHQDKILITGNSLGSVDVVNMDLKAKNVCKHKRCGLNFGLAAHLALHVKHEHSSRI